MMHAHSKKDSEHLALYNSIKSDPDHNNFRASQIAPGCVAGPENWVYCSDDEWTRYFAHYSWFKRKLLQAQQEELTKNPNLSKLISRVDRQLTDKTIHTDHSDRSLCLDRQYYALWDSAESHGICSVTKVVQPQTPLP